MIENKKSCKGSILFIAIYFLVFIALVIIGSFNDMEIEKAVFNPTNGFAKFMEIWGEAPRFAMWGPAATVLLLTRHSLAECLGVIHKILPFIPEIKETQLESKVYKVFNTIVNIIEILGFTVLAVLGWDKLIRNVGKYYVDLSKGVWYLISAAVAVIVILIFTKIPKKTLNKLEPIALMGILLGIIYLSVDPIKSVINRARFREMVAFSYGIEDAKDAAVNRALMDGADFSCYTNWYQKGMGGTRIHNLELEGTSCPSGHMISGCFIFLWAVICKAFDKLKKFTIPVSALCFAYVGTLGFTRMVRGAHFLTDISLGAIVGMAFFLIALAVLRIFEKKDILPVRK